MKAYKPAFLPNEIKAAAATLRIEQQDLVSVLGLSQGTISKLIRGAYKVLPEETLRALCTRWPDKQTGLEILEAYLKDEVIRAGRSLDEVDISIGEPVEDFAFDMHLQAIRHVIMREPDMRRVIAHMGRAAADILYADCKMVPWPDAEIDAIGSEAAQAETPPASKKAKPSAGQES